MVLVRVTRTLLAWILCQTYTVRVFGDEDTEWEVDKRFSSFATLHSELKAYFPTRRLPALPAKRVIGATEPKFLSRRLEALQEYLRGVCKLRHVGRSEPMMTFLASCDTDEQPRTIFKVLHAQPRRAAVQHTGNEERKGQVGDPPTSNRHVGDANDSPATSATAQVTAAGTAGAHGPPPAGSQTQAAQPHAEPG